MTDRPIIFSAPMVLALLAGRKTQTRRIVKPQPTAPLKPGDRTTWGAASMVGDVTWPLGPGISIVSNKPGPHPRWVEEHVKYAVGHRLWVREAWAPLDALTHNDPGPTALINRGFYRADESTVDGEISRWRPSIYMPRWASRLTLIVTEVRVERLNDISEADAKAEGVEPVCDHAVGNQHLHGIAFQQLWDRLHGEGAWIANPWVVAVSFRPVFANIDAHPKAGGLQDERGVR